MTTDPSPPDEPSPALNVLNRLVGIWTVSGPDGLTGAVHAGWMDGGYFLRQQVELHHRGRSVSGVEYIGHDLTHDALTSHYFDSRGARPMYVWQMDGDTLTVRQCGADAPGRLVGMVGEDGNPDVGRRVWPGRADASTLARIV